MALDSLILGLVHEPEEGVMSEPLLDRAGRRRSRQPCRDLTLAARRATRDCATRQTRPRSRRSSLSCTPPGTARTAAGFAVWSVILWRAGLRIQEALDLTEADLDQRRGSLLVRRGQGGRRREVGMDDCKNSSPGSTSELNFRSGRCSASSAGRQAADPGRPRPPAQLRRSAAAAGVRRRFAPHQLRHAHAVEMAREAVPLIAIQRQLGPSNLGITSVYLQGIDNAEIIERPRPPRANGARQRIATALRTPRPLVAQRSTLLTAFRSVGGRRKREPDQSCMMSRWARQIVRRTQCERYCIAAPNRHCRWA